MSHLFNRGGGRKQDPIWVHYERLVTPGKSGSKATCKYCATQMMGIPERLKEHLKKCSAKGTDTPAPSSAFKLRSLATASVPCPMPSEDCEILNEQCTPERDPALENTHPNKRKKTMNSMTNFIVRTTANEKEAFDIQVARFIYATNSPFKLAENKEFLKLIEMLHPGYTPPNRRALANILLDKVHEDVYISCKEKVKGKCFYGT